MPPAVALVLTHGGDDEGETIPEVHRVVDDIGDDAARRGWEEPGIGRPMGKVEVDELRVRPESFAGPGERSPSGKSVITDNLNIVSSFCSCLTACMNTHITAEN